MVFLYILSAVAVILLAAYICFRMAFFADRKATNGEEFPLPEGEIYKPFREQMIQWIKEVRLLPREEVSITSFDGLTLRGNYYECIPGAPIELMFHGYRGHAERDLCGGVQRCFALGHNALIVDQRACGKSEGNVITFGIRESRDCHSWLAFMEKRFGQDVKIILTGISMGAATVLIAAGSPLPKNVIGVLADCGYTSAKEIIQKVIRQLKLPAALAYPFVKLGALIFGGFALEKISPIKAVQNYTVPVIFFHGENDDFVPCQMSIDNYNACRAPRKKLVTIPGAGHGLSYLVDPQHYLRSLKEFWAQ